MRLGMLLGITLLGAGLFAPGPVAAETTCRIDIGGPMDELFIGDGWYQAEGPYEQYDALMRNTFRWAAQGATVRIPVFPGVRTKVAVRCRINAVPGQKLICSLDGKTVATLDPQSDYVYRFTVPADAVGSAKWDQLSLRTEKPGLQSTSDPRDLTAAVDWIEVSADAPERGFMAEAMLDRGSVYEGMAQDKAPDEWRMRYDPIDVGESFAPMSFLNIQYDDSGWDRVTTRTTPRGLRRGDAVWYKAWVLIDGRLDDVRKSLRLPGEGCGNDGLREVWVNGTKVPPDGPGTLRDRTARMLTRGASQIAVRIMKGPLPRTSGDTIVEQPRYTGKWSPRRVTLSVGPLALSDPMSPAKTLTVRLVSPSGKIVGATSGDVADLRNARRGLDPKAAWPLTEYGEHSLIVQDDRGHEQRFPVHYLGIHFFHWGWYSAAGGTGWDGFKPCSNEFIDQLFSHLDDWRRPHHSITWGGAIIAPGTGFHKTPNADYIGQFRDAIAAGKLGFVGAPFPPRNICTDFGETLLRSMRKSLDLYQSQFGIRPTTFVSHDATLTPLLPQIMQLCGYDTYCAPDNWWGQGASVPVSRDSYWSNADGTRVRLMTSWYHGQPPITQARRAVEQGKPAILCNEEFACLDPTVFLTQSDLDSMAAEGILANPVSLDEYRRITEPFAQEHTYQGDDNLCYKGWTGGGEGEFEYEKANPLLETRLVALENLAAYARWVGIEVDQKQIDDLWDKSLRLHECHTHWGNGYPESTQLLRQGVATVDAEMSRISGLIAHRVKGDGEGVTVVNPLGFRRSGLVKVELPSNVQSLTHGGKAVPVQRDAEKPETAYVSIPDLPSCGYVDLRCSARSASATNGVTVIRPSSADRPVVLGNGLVSVSVAADGTITSVVDVKSRRTVLTNANRIHLARPQGASPNEPLSDEKNPLNLKHYCTPVASGKPRVVEAGPVVTTVECSLRVPEYPAISMKARISLVQGERQARIRLMVSFAERTVIRPKGSPDPHEGTYVPGIFVAFPMDATVKPMADMAYCVTDGVLSSTNHETFMKMPFRNGTFNALSMAGPSTGDYAVLTRGLPDFFVIRKPEQYMGMSLGVGVDWCPYHDYYVHEYAIYAPEPGQRRNAKPLAYKAAQSFLVDPIAVTHSSGTGDLPNEASFVGADSDTVIIPGVELLDGRLQFRVLQLDDKPTKARIHCLHPLSGAKVLPNGAIADGVMELGSRALREVVSDR